MDTVIKERIDHEIASSSIVLFMRGTPIFPQCTFSSQAVHLLNLFGLKYKAIDVLTDTALQQGIRDYGSGAALPHLYVCGEFLGSSYVLKTMIENGKFEKLLQEKNIPYKARP
ncbi:MAG: monothiol glutaredoxin, Grx4 family [Alphaproteobacteria bacterium]|nr:monothiol glutaredoxin, Grx4 family [Alphaproteobacteria bacterium]MCL2505057.1 monothiol glutaredoxin, Grx4 family [Alphaproteobacteria bacterium]